MSKIIREDTPEKVAEKIVQQEGHAQIGSEEKGESAIFKFAEYVLPVKQAAAVLRQDDNNGFTEDREMRLIGTIPMSVFVNRPELLRDENALRKFLRGEGSCYATVRKGI